MLGMKRNRKKGVSAMWIGTVEYEDASGRLKALYDRVRAPGGQIDNIMKAHALRPHSMEGHMTLYKYVLHHELSPNLGDGWDQAAA